MTKEFRQRIVYFVIEVIDFFLGIFIGLLLVIKLFGPVSRRATLSQTNQVFVGLDSAPLPTQLEWFSSTL